MVPVPVPVPESDRVCRVCRVSGGAGGAKVKGWELLNEYVCVFVLFISITVSAEGEEGGEEGEEEGVWDVEEGEGECVS
jgi:hypothetical protein